jgi:hypothetical protein
MRFGLLGWHQGAALAALLVCACGGKADTGTPGDGGPVGTTEGGVEAGPVGEGGPVGSEGGPVGPAPVVRKLDLLFMIDNSASMGDKQALLAGAVPDMLQRLAVATDVHIGIVTSSLGGRGGDQCPDTATNPANPSLSAHNDDRGELINRGGVLGNPTVEAPVADIKPSNILSWFPPVAANQGQPPPPTKPIGDQATLVSDFTTMVAGVHEHGCGFEAQNEAWYRFLVQPDPFDQITKNNTRAVLNGVDATILQQRHDFLRPDSMLVIVVVTDENEEAVDPLSIGGQGWAFTNQSFPGSPNGAAPEGTIECQSQDPNNPTTTGPNDPNCTSCAFISSSDPSYATRCPKDGANGTGGYLDPNDDSLNTRFFHQKKRFGLFAGYPTSRYVRGLTRATVPNVPNEHDANGNYIGDQDAMANCVNPIFAASLPTSPSADLCNLTPGSRDPRLVFYTAIAGVPHQLLQAKPGDPECPSSTNAADCPQKSTLTPADWVFIHGQDPEHYDFRGADFHMVESWDARTTQGVMANASSCPPTAPDTCDPINGREWATNKGDLQFACIFRLPAPKDCSQPNTAGACDCATGALNEQTPLCQKDASGQTTQIQINGKAYPSVREMVIAHALGSQGVVSSICPIHVTEQTPGDPLYGYRPAVDTLFARISPSLP